MNRDKTFPIHSEKTQTVNLGYFTNELFWNLLLRQQLEKAEQMNVRKPQTRFIVNR